MGRGPELTQPPPTPVRDATPEDVGGIVAIVNEVIATSTAIFSDEPATLEGRLAWLAERRGRGYPVLVAGAPGTPVLGFATFGDFRAGNGYRHTVEQTVHVRADARGRGLGDRLVRALIARASALDKRVVVAGIDGDNAASIRFHERLGFEVVGRMGGVGRKFDRPLDLVLMQRRTDPR